MGKDGSQHMRTESVSPKNRENTVDDLAKEFDCHAQKFTKVVWGFSTVSAFLSVSSGLAYIYTESLMPYTMGLFTLSCGALFGWGLLTFKTIPDLELKAHIYQQIAGEPDGGDDNDDDGDELAPKDPPVIVPPRLMV